MKKFKVISDPSNTALNVSTNLIVSNLNSAAKKLELFDENGIIINYDCLGDAHGQRFDASICCFELPFPEFIINNLQDKPCITVSRDNIDFAISVGYPKNLVDYVCLGVDSNLWKFNYKRNYYKNDETVCLLVGESNSRNPLHLGIEAFGFAFQGQQDVTLYIKDRNSSPTFRDFVNQKAAQFQIKVILDDSDIQTQEEMAAIYNKADFALYLNSSTTWGLIPPQLMANGLPVLCMNYCGPREYVSHAKTALEIDYDLVEYTDNYVKYLKSLGFRHHLFPRSMFHVTPLWAYPRLESIIDNLILIRNHCNLREKLGLGGRALMEKFTWERSAAHLSVCLSQWF